MGVMEVETELRVPDAALCAGAPDRPPAPTFYRPDSHRPPAFNGEPATKTTYGTSARGRRGQLYESHRILPRSPRRYRQCHTARGFASWCATALVLCSPETRRPGNFPYTETGLEPFRLPCRTSRSTLLSGGYRTGDQLRRHSSQPGGLIVAIRSQPRAVDKPTNIQSAPPTSWCFETESEINRSTIQTPARDLCDTDIS